MAPAQYRFETTWVLESSRQDAWNTITNPITWTQWWPGFLGVRNATFKPEVVGASFRAAWKSQIGYVIKLNITITDIHPMGLIVFSVMGDLEGVGEWRFSDSGDQTKIATIWDVKTTKWWMNLLAPIARAQFMRNHDLLMRSGEKGLNSYLKNLK